MTLSGTVLNAGASIGNVLGGLTATSGLRLPVLAFSIAAVQALLIDDLGGSLFLHLDLPLAVVISSSLARPGAAVVTGFVFGLAVDSFQLKLFGLHGLAYCLLGPLAAVVPVGMLRSRAEIIISLATAQCLAATAVVLIGARAVDGSFPPGMLAHVVQATLWSVVISVPLTSLLGARMGLATPEPNDRLLPPTSAEWP